VSIKVATMPSLETISPRTGVIVVMDLCGGFLSWPGTIVGRETVESSAPGTSAVAWRSPAGSIACRASGGVGAAGLQVRVQVRAGAGGAGACTAATGRRPGGGATGQRRRRRGLQTLCEGF
jgi:hypothetical protein